MSDYDLGSDYNSKKFDKKMDDLIERGVSQRTMASTLQDVFNQPLFNKKVSEKQLNMIKKAQRKEGEERIELLKSQAEMEHLQSQAIQRQMLKVNSIEKKDDITDCYISKNTLIIKFNNPSSDLIHISLHDSFQVYCSKSFIKFDMVNSLDIKVTYPENSLKKIKDILSDYYKSKKVF